MTREYVRGRSLEERRRIDRDRRRRERGWQGPREQLSADERRARQAAYYRRRRREDPAWARRKDVGSNRNKAIRHALAATGLTRETAPRDYLAAVVALYELRSAIRRCQS